METITTVFFSCPECGHRDCVPISRSECINGFYTTCQVCDLHFTVPPSDFEEGDCEEDYYSEDDEFEDFQKNNYPTKLEATTGETMEDVSARTYEIYKKLEKCVTEKEEGLKTYLYEDAEKIMKKIVG